MATYGSARNDTPSSARSAASSIGGKGGTSGSSSTGGARSGAGGAGGVRGGGKSESAGSKATSAAAGAASSVGSKSSAASSVGARSANAATGPNNYGGGRNSDTTTAMGQRGLLGSDRGGSILSSPSVVSQSGGLLGTALANSLAGLNRMDRTTVEQGTAFGKRYGLDTGYGISLMDPSRFSIKPGVNLANVQPSALTRAINGQLLFGKPVSIVEGYAPGTGHVKNSQHYRGLALDLHAPTPEDRPGLITAMTQAGFTGTGTYPNLPNSVHVDLRTAGAPTWSGAAKGGYGRTPGWHTAAVQAGQTPGNWDSVVSDMSGQPSPTMTAAVQSAPKMQDRIAAEPNLNGLGFQQAAYNDRGTPSPMAGQGILGPSGLANMADLGMRQAVSPVSQRQTMAQMGNPIGGMSFNPGLPGQMPGPDRSRSPGIDGSPMTASAPRSMGPDMARTDTPTSAWNGDVLGPINPQPLSAGMSFNPGMPRNPISGMAFNPSMPRNPIGGMAFNPGMPGQMPSDPRSRSPFVSGPPQIASRQPDPFAGLANVFPQTEKRITAADIPAIASPDQRTRVIGNWPSFGPMGIPDQPGLQGPVNVADLPEPAPMVSPPATIQDAPSPLDRVQPKDVEKVINKLTDAFHYLGTSPEKRMADARHFDTRENYSDRGRNLPTQWTGHESESQVAAMAKNVEEVLRGYFVQIPGQQYPQYTTGPA